ncbi:hypothetical protein AYI68_g4010 [Smittium mucronatum]|uniref:Mediator of RNA polymerase II transcription subunit 1 n=2 Tax=Smittium mucronatum TaxID=133383 RepID=A0A1R0GYA0_9FUNG|nr:hypothetical protein AYI68_g4010 [Smittium mucronatum]
MTVLSIHHEINAIKDLAHSINSDLISEAYPEASLNPFGPKNLEIQKQRLLDSLQKIKTGLLNFNNAKSSFLRDCQNIPLISDLSTPTLSDLEAIDRLNVKKVLTTFKSKGEKQNLVSTLYRDLKACRTDLDLVSFEKIRFQVLHSSPSYDIRISNWRKYLKKLSERIGLNHYEDDSGKENVFTTVTICGDVFVLDVDIGNDGNIHKAAVSYAIDDVHDGNDNLSRLYPNLSFFIKSKKQCEDLKSLLIAPNSNMTSQELIDLINNKNGVLSYSCIDQGATLTIRIPPIVTCNIDHNELLQIASGKSVLHHCLDYSQSVWFGWEANPRAFHKLSKQISSNNFDNEKSDILDLNAKDKNKDNDCTLESKNENIMEIETIADPSVKLEGALAGVPVIKVEGDILLPKSDDFGSVKPKGMEMEDTHLGVGNPQEAAIDSFELNNGCFYTQVARFEPYIWCCPNTINSITKIIESDFEVYSNQQNYVENDPFVLIPSSEGFALESLVSRDSVLSENGDDNRLYSVKRVEEIASVAAHHEDDHHDNDIHMKESHFKMENKETHCIHGVSIRDEILLAVGSGGVITAKLVSKNDQRDFRMRRTNNLNPNLSASGEHNTASNDLITRISNSCSDVPTIVAHWAEYRAKRG